ncbi:hypothetical protein [Gillisia sp. Hel_I_29]|uniref:hypothetical protein n=1 Tax=Gillisia sp. Hel_I_29 TaxID=1249975 RepID=UPI0005521997|nr:hypothetical protein [Gillisia sp. Hel_I_29]
MTGYELTRNWFDFSFANPDKVKPRHTALYLFSADLCNRLGWKRKFGIPTVSTMEAVGIGNYNTYKNTLNDLIEWGFIELITKSKNQHSANVIALCKSAEANNKALDKAIMNHSRSSVDIIKPQTNKTLNHKKISEIEISEVPIVDLVIYKYGIELRKVILDNASQKNIPIKKVEDAKYKNWLEPLRFMLQKDKISEKHLKDIINYLRNPSSEFWRKTILSTTVLRKNSSQILSEINSSKKTNVGKITTNDSLTSRLESYE